MPCVSRTDQEDLSSVTEAFWRINNIEHHVCSEDHSNPAQGFRSGGIVVDGHRNREQRVRVVSIQGTDEEGGIVLKLGLPDECLRLVVRAMDVRKVWIQRAGISCAEISQVGRRSIGSHVWVGQFDSAIDPMTCDIDNPVKGSGDLVVVRKDDGL